MPTLPRFSDTPFSLVELESRRLMATSFDIGINVNDNASATVAKVTPILKNLDVETVRLWASVSDWDGRTLGGAFQRAVDYSNAGFDVTLAVNPKDGIVPDPSDVKSWFDWASNNTALKNAVDRWEIGNEPDHYEYWRGSLSQYVTGYLKPAYEALHADGETVVSAGPSYNPADVQTMINAGMLSYTDYVGFHPYATGVAGVKKSVAAINAVVAGRKPIAVTEWNVRGLEGNKTEWAAAVEEVFPTIRDGFALNYYFAMKLQNSPAGPGGILTNAFGYNQPFYNAFATFEGNDSDGGSTDPDSGGGNTPSAPTGSISGVAFNDSDVDGVFDSSENASGSRVIYLDANGNGALDAGEKSTTANSQGAYAFTGLALGSYKVSRVFPAGFKLSNNADGYVTTTVAVGQKVTGVNLGTTYSRTTTPNDDAPEVTGFELVNAVTNKVITSIAPIVGNTTVDLSDLPTSSINLRIATAGGTASVKVTALGTTKVENTTPYSVFGDTFGDYAAWTASKRSVTVSATAYSGANATGTASAPMTTTITFI